MDFSPRIEEKKCKEANVFAPHFDANGFLTAIMTDVVSRELLMVAHMNAQALGLTLETGIAHFWSRSRNCLWKKGASSGNLLYVKEIHTDCDQDALWLKVQVKGDGAACHTGAKSCFYRQLNVDKNVVRLISDFLFS
ncbi:MAG: phosphoribosyl-AMP cyclohydrolase [Candidatus Tokpelaia sp. JSC085]|nr:MAG: phosphoribosyl-AMP cyclohydrolase [Candidatus Tokpelaia sp. JSC085]